MIVRDRNLNRKDNKNKARPLIRTRLPVYEIVYYIRGGRFVPG